MYERHFGQRIVLRDFSQFGQVPKLRGMYRLQ